MAISAGAIVAKLKLDGKQFTRGVGQAGKSLDGLESKGLSAQKALGSIAVASGAAFVAIAGTIAVAVKRSAEFETGLREIKTLGVDRSIDDIGAAVTRLTTAYGQESQTAIKAYYDAISAGVAAADVEGFLEVAARLATVGASDMATAVDGLTSAANAFGIAFSDANVIADSFMATIAGGKTTLDEYASAVGRVAPIASAFGIQDGITGLKELNAGLATITLNGLSNAESATAMRAVFKSLANPTKDAANAASILGFEMGVTATQARGLVGSVNELVHLIQNLKPGTDEYAASAKELTRRIEDERKADKSLSDKGLELLIVLENLKKGTLSQAEALKLMFTDVEALTGAQILLKDGAKVLNEQMIRQAESAGLVSREFKRFTNENFDFAVRQLKEEFAALFVSMGGPFKNAVLPMIEGMRDAIRSAREWIDENQELAKWFGITGLAITGLVTVVAGLAAAIAPLAVTLASASVALGGIGVGGAAAGAGILAMTGTVATVVALAAAVAVVGVEIATIIGLLKDIDKAKKQAAATEAITQKQVAPGLRGRQVARFGETNVAAAEAEVRAVLEAKRANEVAATEEAARKGFGIAREIPPINEAEVRKQVASLLAIRLAAGKIAEVEGFKSAATDAATAASELAASTEQAAKQIAKAAEFLGTATVGGTDFTVAKTAEGKLITGSSTGEITEVARGQTFGKGARRTVDEVVQAAAGVTASGGSQIADGDKALLDKILADGKLDKSEIAQIVALTTDESLRQLKITIQGVLENQRRSPGDKDTDAGKQLIATDAAQIAELIAEFKRIADQQGGKELGSARTDLLRAQLAETPDTQAIDTLTSRIASLELARGGLTGGAPIEITIQAPSLAGGQEVFTKQQVLEQHTVLVAQVNAALRTFDARQND